MKLVGFLGGREGRGKRIDTRNVCIEHILAGHHVSFGLLAFWKSVFKGVTRTLSDFLAEVLFFSRDPE